MSQVNPNIQRLLNAALVIAIEPPVRPSKGSCYVTAKAIGQLRATFELMGIDWRKTKAEVDAAWRAECGAKGTGSAP